MIAILQFFDFVCKFEILIANCALITLKLRVCFRLPSFGGNFYDLARLQTFWNRSTISFFKLKQFLIGHVIDIGIMRICFSFAFFNRSLKHHILSSLSFSVRVKRLSDIHHISQHQLKHYIFVNIVLAIVSFPFRIIFLLQYFYLLLLCFQLVLQLDYLFRLLLVFIL